MFFDNTVYGIGDNSKNILYINENQINNNISKFQNSSMGYGSTAQMLTCDV